MPKLPVLGKELVELGLAFLEVFRDLSSVLGGCYGRDMGTEIYLCLDVISFFAEILH